MKLYRCPEERCPSRHLCGHAVAHERHNCQQMGDCPSCRPLKTRTLWQVVSPEGKWWGDNHRTRRGAQFEAATWPGMPSGPNLEWRPLYRRGWRVIRTTQVEG
jgi:hypothetical protein